MKHCLSLLCCLLCSWALRAAPGDTTRVLFIGNSFTYTEDVPGLVKNFADIAKLPFKYVMHAPPGATVGDTDQGPYAHMFNPYVYDLIRSDHWDYVCLQENQGRFLYGGGIFPDPNKCKVIEGHMTIRDSVHYHNQCAHMLWFAGWAFKDGYPGIGATGKDLIDNIYENYKFLYDKAGEIISPIGIAWNRCNAVLPGIDLWSPDEAHQSAAGSYITAAVIFTSIFKVNTEQIPFNAALDTATARIMRKIAYETVMDSAVSNGLNIATPSLALSGSTLTAGTGYTKYDWYHNGMPVGTSPTNVFTISSAGCYHVRATDINGCVYRSKEICTAPTSVTEPGHRGAPFLLYPQPAGDVVNIVFSGAATAGFELHIYDIRGMIVKSYQSKDNKAAVALDGLPSGVYQLTISTGEDRYHQKLVISK